MLLCRICHAVAVCPSVTFGAETFWYIVIILNDLHGCASATMI